MRIPTFRNFPRRHYQPAFPSDTKPLGLRVPAAGAAVKQQYFGKLGEKQGKRINPGQQFGPWLTPAKWLDQKNFSQQRAARMFSGAVSPFFPCGTA
jgi:hypothetical protein